MSKKISVIMGVYNAEYTVEDAVISIVNQTEQNIEIIICDDGSTDNTYSILQRLRNKYEHIILLQNEQNRGLAYSLNRCMETATGDYFARMDADDVSKPERLRTQREFLDKHPEYELVGCGMIMVDDNHKESYVKVCEEPDETVFPVRVPFLHATTMMRRSMMEHLGGYTVDKVTRRCEDVELWYRFFENKMKGYNLPDYLYIKPQGINDYKRRKVIHGIEMFRMHVRGLRRINASAYKYLLTVKPIISAMMPKRIMMSYHNLKFRKRE